MEDFFTGATNSSNVNLLAELVLFLAYVHFVRIGRVSQQNALDVVDQIEVRYASRESFSSSHAPMRSMA